MLCSEKISKKNILFFGYTELITQYFLVSHILLEHAYLFQYVVWFVIMSIN